MPPSIRSESVPEAARALAELGLRVFRVARAVDGGCACGPTCASPGKHPLVAGWQAGEPPEAFQAEDAIGIATGAVSGVVVVDVDPDKATGEVRWPDDAPATWTAVTGRGGYHLFFRHPGGQVKNSVKTLAPDVDVRGDGGYVVAAPSPHVSGQPYEWAEGLAPGEVELAPLPVEWLERMRGGKARAPLAHVLPEELESIAAEFPGADTPADMDALREAVRTYCAAHRNDPDRARQVDLLRRVLAEEPLADLGARETSVFLAAGTLTFLLRRRFSLPAIRMLFEPSIRATPIEPGEPEDRAGWFRALDEKMSAAERNLFEREASSRAIMRDLKARLVRTTAAVRDLPEGAQLPEEADAGDAAGAADDFSRLPNQEGVRELLRQCPDPKDWPEEFIPEVVAPAMTQFCIALRRPDGIVTMFERGAANELSKIHEKVKLERFTTLLAQAFGRTLAPRYCQRIYQEWLHMAPRLDAEPSPFAFKGTAPTFHRFDWEPCAGPFPAWEEFLSRLSDREAFMAFIWSLFEPDNRSRQYLWLHGKGMDGKSYVLNVLGEVFGPAAHSVNDAALRADRFLNSALYGKRVVVYPDCTVPSVATTEFVRSVTSRDRVSVEFKGETPFQAFLNLRLLVASNHLPQITGEKADVSRCMVIDVAPAAKNTPRWDDDLRRELPGFLGACREAYASRCPDGGAIQVSERARESVEECVESADARWEDLFNALFVPDTEGAIRQRDVYSAVCQYDKDLRKDDRAVGEFKKYLGRRGFTVRRKFPSGVSGPRCYHGFRKRGMQDKAAT